MKLIRGGVLLIGLLGVASAAQAGVTSTWTLTNDYDFRGNTQSAKDPAIQASIDYAHESGFVRRRVGQQHRLRSAGGWSARRSRHGDRSVCRLHRTLEGSGLTYDVGIVGYTYPDESDFNYTEIYASLAKGWFKGKVSVLAEVRRQGGGRSRASARRQGRCRRVVRRRQCHHPAARQLLAARPRGLQHRRLLGQRVRRRPDRLAVGVGYTAGHFSLGLKWVDTDGDVKVTSDAFQQRRPRDRDGCDYLPLERIRSTTSFSITCRQ